MKIAAAKPWKHKYLALSFAVPFCGMLFVMLCSGYEPFGHYSMLYSDMYHQYYPFFVAFRQALRSGDGLLYTWSVGMGMDYLGLISYYLASPLNLLSVLVPDGLVLEYFSLLMPTKLGLAGLFFAIFLKDIFEKNDLSLPLFGGFYGLCAWAMGFQWNVMWLDTFALLPLVVLGMVHLIRDKKWILYTLTLFLSIFSNYYIGFFTCIFIFLSFFCYEICAGRGWKAFFRDLCRIALFSVIAIGMTAILELPALAALQTTQSSVNKFPTTFRLNIAKEHTIKGLLDAMRQVAGNLGGSIEPNFKDGLPNIYCGVGTLFFSMLFFLAWDVKLRDKLCCLFLLLFFNVSFIIRQLDYIWHGFHFTNMIPYRFSFLHCFVMLYMAYRGWLLRKKFRPLAVITGGLMTATILCCSEQLLATQSADLLGLELEIPVYILYNGIFFLLYLGALLYGSFKRRLPQDADEQTVRESKLALHQCQAISGVWFQVVVAVELVATLTSFALWFPGTNVSNYPRGTEEAASMIRYMHEREEDTLFFRAETNHSQTLNDGALNGYRGVSTFTSSANVKTTEFMKALGYGAKNTYNRYCYEESSPVADLFLGIKYQIEREGKEKGSFCWQDVHHYGKVHLLQNNFYLPLGFLAQNELALLDFQDQASPFGFQNELFANATGLDRQVWRQIPEESLTIASTGVTLTQQSGGNCTYEGAEKNAYITYTYDIPMEGFMCIHLNFPKRNDYYVSANGVELYKETISLPQMIAVGDVRPGDQVEIRVQLDAGEKSSLTIDAQILDNELFQDGYQVLSASTWELTKFESTFVEGTISCNRDGLMYTSIPQNGNWEVTVDGAPGNTALVGDCMIGVYLTEGDHVVSMRYNNRAFSLGWKISLLCALLFGGLILICYPDYRRSLLALLKREKKQPPKYRKNNKKKK